MKKWTFILGLAVVLMLAACGNSEQPETVEARAVFELDRVYVDGVEVEEADYAGSTLTFVGPEQGGNVLIRVGENTVQASINPSREHPSFESGEWHHHLYAASTEAGSERINFVELFPELGIDVNPEATDNSQSAYQHGNLHYLVEEGQFRLRFTINGEVHELMFVEV